jgi:hypothetical protein
MPWLSNNRKIGFCAQKRTKANLSFIFYWFGKNGKRKTAFHFSQTTDSEIKTIKD